MKRATPMESGRWPPKPAFGLSWAVLEIRKCRVRREWFQKAKAPSIARGFEILDDVRQTLTMINGAFELSINFGIE